VADEFLFLFIGLFEIEMTETYPVDAGDFERRLGDFIEENRSPIDHFKIALVDAAEFFMESSPAVRS
jgi:hypothetical protein